MKYTQGTHLAILDENFSFVWEILTWIKVNTVWRGPRLLDLKYGFTFVKNTEQNSSMTPAATCLKHLKDSLLSARLKFGAWWKHMCPIATPSPKVVLLFAVGVDTCSYKQTALDSTHPSPAFWHWCRKENDSFDPENSATPSSLLLISWCVATILGFSGSLAHSRRQVNPG